MAIPYEAGKVFQVKELFTIPEGKGEKHVLFDTRTKGVLVCLDEGCSLPEHAAPCGVMVAVMEGAAVIRCDGQDHTVHAGENFCFEEGTMHQVTAEKPLKMMVLHFMGE